MKADEFATARQWETASRLVVLGLLFLSAFTFLMTAIVFGSLGESEADKLIAAGCMLAAGVAVAVAIAFRKSGAPTWKQKVVVAVIALPAALSLLAR